MNISSITLDISINILPFGHVTIKSKGSEVVKDETMKQPPVYSEPKTTDTKAIEIDFEGQNHVVPKTTGGLLYIKPI
jgi:hypothetical protein